MTPQTAMRIRAAFAVILASAALAGCAGQKHSGITRVRLSERECLARAMYFESNRSSDAGMLAVGTVVMNRVQSGKFGSTVCEVVGAPRQFAPGVLTRSMTDSGAPRARRIADAVLAGRRHPAVQNAKFFHTAGYKFPYNNMRYVLVAGGNAFYDKTKAPKTWYGGEGRWGPPPAPTERIDGGPILVANVEVQQDEPAPRRAAPAPETRMADTRMAAAPAPRRGGSVGGIPTYEPAPGSREARETQVAMLEPSRRPRASYDAGRRPATIEEDNGLREEDRWRDQELAEDQGRSPAASEDDWSRRRETSVARVETAPLPVVETRPTPRAERPASRAPREDGYGSYEPREDRAPRGRAPETDYAAAEPERPREVRTATRSPRTVETRQRPMMADAAPSGWSVGAQPVRTEANDPSGGDYSPLSNAASEAGYEVDAQAKRPARRAATQPRRSYEGVELSGGDQVQYGYR